MMVLMLGGLLHGRLVRRVSGDERASRIDARASAAARRQLIRRRRARARPTQTKTMYYKLKISCLHDTEKTNLNTLIPELFIIFRPFQYEMRPLPSRVY